MSDNTEFEQGIVFGEVRRWRLIAHRFCLLLDWPNLRYAEPLVRFSAEPTPALKSLDIISAKSEPAVLAARISITDEEYGQGDGGLRLGFRDIVVEVYSDDLCDDLLREFEKWYAATGKNVRFVLQRPRCDDASHLRQKFDSEMFRCD